MSSRTERNISAELTMEPTKLRTRLVVEGYGGRELLEKFQV